MDILGTVTLAIQQLEQGENSAARKLWDRYFDRVSTLAKELMIKPIRIGDEEDVAVSVLKSLCIRAKEGRYQSIESRDELWVILFAMTKNKSIDWFRYESSQKRDLRRTVPISSLKDHQVIDDLVSSDPTPEYLFELDENFKKILTLLNDHILKKIAVLKMEGYNTDQIATSLSISPRTVERRTADIRAILLERLEDASV